MGNGSQLYWKQRKKSLQFNSRWRERSDFFHNKWYLITFMFIILAPEQLIILKNKQARKWTFQPLHSRRIITSDNFICLTHPSSHWCRSTCHIGLWYETAGDKLMALIYILETLLLCGLSGAGTKLLATGVRKWLGLSHSKEPVSAVPRKVSKRSSR